MSTENPTLKTHTKQEISDVLAVAHFLALREDFYLSRLAEKRDTSDVKWMNFEDVWK